MSTELKFIADAMLGRLARWLRVIGFDTLYFHGRDKKDLIEKARAEGRVILTRDTRLVSQKELPPCLFISSNYVWEQLKEVSQRYHILPPEKAFTLCSSCNVPLKPVSKDEVNGRVPDYIYTQYRRFSVCPCCQRIYWAGSHYESMASTLEGLSPDGA